MNVDSQLLLGFSGSKVLVRVKDHEQMIDVFTRERVYEKWKTESDLTLKVNVFN